MMRRRYVVLSGAGLLLALFFVARQTVADYVAYRLVPGDPVLDAAIEFYGRNRSTAFGAIDRWAYQGMPVELVISLLKKGGYVCLFQDSPSAPEQEQAVRQRMICEKRESWPIDRRLQIRASIEYRDGSHRGYLVGADAISMIDGEETLLRRNVADLLRKTGWLEPEKMVVTGLTFASVDELSRFVFDAITIRWQYQCGDFDAFENSVECRLRRKYRADSGFATIPDKPAAISLSGIHRALTDIGFRASYGSYQPEKPIVVRLSDGKMWVDFFARDLRGQEETVSAELDPAAGSVVRMIVKMNTTYKEFQVAEKLPADHSYSYLFPLAGEENPRTATWVYLRNLDRIRDDHNKLFQLRDTLSNVDPDFAPQLMRAVVEESRPDVLEYRLNLYPELSSIERLADGLRLTQVERWMPYERWERIGPRNFADQPAVRAAWAMAVCEPDDPVLRGNTECWQQFVSSDTEAAAHLRHAVEEALADYAELPPAHPLRMRLGKLSEADTAVTEETEDPSSGEETGEE